MAKIDLGVALATPDPEDLAARAARLKLYGLLAHWGEYGSQPWVARLIALEEEERTRRSLERRVKAARLGRFKLVPDFDWTWPTHIDRELSEEIFTLDFLREASNVVFMGPNGVGKTMLAQNLAHQAVLRGHTVCFTTASELLNELAAQDSSASLARRLQRACRPQLLVIDEVGYLSQPPCRPPLRVLEPSASAALHSHHDQPALLGTPSSPTRAASSPSLTASFIKPRSSSWPVSPTA